MNKDVFWSHGQSFMYGLWVSAIAQPKTTPLHAPAKDLLLRTMQHGQKELGPRSIIEMLCI